MTERRDNRRLAAAVVACLALLFGLKAWLAWGVPLFGDEAFYWLESRHPAPAYSDLPFLTAFLIRAGTAVAGDTYFGVRIGFLLLGTAIPALVWQIAADLAGRRAAWWAAGATACLPLAAVLGVLALPDVPLVALGLAGLLAFVRAAGGGGGWWWVAAGAFTALGLCTHYRFAALLAGPALWCLATPCGRALLVTPGPWVAVLIAASGLAPVAWFNLQHDFAGLAFQFIERHPWRFQAEGWRFLPVQVLVATPLMFAGLLAALIAGAGERRGDGTGPRIVVFFSAALIGGFTLAAFFADAERTSAHWPLVAYLPLLTWLPGVLAAVPRGIRWLAPATGAAGTLLVVAYLAMAPRPEALAGLVGGKAFPDNFVGWREAARAAAVQRGTGRGVLVAGNFMLAAELDFELEGADRVYSLNHPLNTRHGRARQMAIWGLDEAGLARQEAGSRAVVVIEETALKIGDRPAWIRRLCRLFDGLAYTGEVSVAAGRKRFLHFEGTVRRQPGAPPEHSLPTRHCDLPPHAYLIQPRPGDRIAGTTRVHGWAVEDNDGVARVELLVDGRRAASTSRFHDYPDVARFLPGSVDPRHPKVGFAMRWDPSGLAPGQHEIAIRVITRDGNERILENREIRVPARD